jgi:hypothetical protein
MCYMQVPSKDDPLVLTNQWCGHVREGEGYKRTTTKWPYFKTSDNVFGRMLKSVTDKFLSDSAVRRQLHNADTNLVESHHNTQVSMVPQGKRTFSGQAGIYSVCMQNAATRTNEGHNFVPLIIEGCGLPVPFSVLEHARTMDMRQHGDTKRKRTRIAKGHKKRRKLNINKNFRMKSLDQWRYTSNIDIESDIESESSDGDSEQDEIDQANAGVATGSETRRVELEDYMDRIQEAGFDVNDLRARFPLPHEVGRS